MSPLQPVRIALLAFVLLLTAPSLALAAVSTGQPFPSDLFTVIDKNQLTGLRVALPKPDCATNPSDCADVDVLNTLDGFNVDARVSIPFSGAIDLSTVTPATVFLTDRKGARVPLDRLVWTSATNTLHGNPAVYLDQDTTYLLVVTDGVRAADGSALEATDFREEADDDYGRDLFRSLWWARVPKSRIVAASLFTTQSITSILEQVRRQIDQTKPAPARFDLGPAGTRTVFPWGSIALVTFNRQTGTSTFTPFAAAARSRRLPGRDRHRRLRPVHVAGLRDGAEGDPRLADAQGGADPAAGHERDLLQPLPAVGPAARGRLAGRDLRARLHRLEAGLPARDRLDDGKGRDRDGRDQRRRARRRAARAR